MWEKVLKESPERDGKRKKKKRILCAFEWWWGGGEMKVTDRQGRRIVCEGTERFLLLFSIKKKNGQKKKQN